MKQLVLAAAAALISACSGSYARTASVAITADSNTLGNDGTKLNLTAVALDTAGNPGTGSVVFTTTFGDLNGTGGASASVATDAAGVARATYACDVAKEARCLGVPITINVDWSGATSHTTVTLHDLTASSSTPDGGTPDGGTPDAGTPPPPRVLKVDSTAVTPGFIAIASAANPSGGLAGAALLTFTVTDTTANVPASGVTVTFAEKASEFLVTLSSTTATTDADGVATVTATSLNTVGTAHVIASVSGGATATATLPITGGPTAIVWKSATPSVLGLKGSGIQETGLMTFAITDPLGTPVPGVLVDFTQNQPALVSFSKPSAVTDINGIAAVSYTAGPEVGVSSVVATVRATGASTARSVAVRGARPSASGFYFACNTANLPVYTTTARIETTTCTVRLSDRFGNRVGIATPVNFAAEAGSISASVTTKAFDFNNPSDPNEGTATVTFSTDMGNGTSPADVAPLAQDDAQYPWPRQAEPQVADGQLVRNPRDQLVTIIAMTQGEEAFVDNNHNGVLDNDEVFVDLGDPFVDANDDGQYDQIYPGGPWELRFCGQTGSSCTDYQGPNGKWDSLTNIWVPTWVVFSGVAGVSTAPAGQAAPATDYSPACIAHTASGFASVYVYDAYLNTPASGATFGTPQVERGTVTVKKHGFGAQLDSWGAMGTLGFDFDYRLVGLDGGLCQTPASPTAPTPCVQKLLFKNFDLGFQGTVEAVAPNTGTGSCSAPAPFETSIQANGAHGTYSIAYQDGTYAN